MDILQGEMEDGMAYYVSHYASGSRSSLRLQRYVPLSGGFSWPGFSHLLECQEVFVPDRCSIGFHPLHTYPAIATYMLLLLFPRTRVVAIGLVLHMLTDYQDCLW